MTEGEDTKGDAISPDAPMPEGLGDMPLLPPPEDGTHSTGPWLQPTGAPFPPVPADGGKVLGIASLVTGLVLLPAIFCLPLGFVVGFVGAIAGGVMGVMGIRRARAEERENIPAIVGLAFSIVLGIVSLFSFLLLILFLVAMARF